MLPALLDAGAIDALVAPADLVAAAERSFRAISEGTARQPARSLMRLERGAFGLMPGELTDPAVFGVKLVSLFADAPARGRSSHQGLVVLFDGRTGAPRLVADAGHLTALRTAAASVVSARLLARQGPYTLGLVGAGEQAAAHLALFRAVLPPRRTIVWARRPEAADRFAGRNGEIAIAASVEQVCADADVICTLTQAADPLLFGRWLRPGQHLIAAGSSTPDRREIDSEAVARCAVYVDWREGAEREGGDIRAAIEAGLCRPEIVRGEIGEVLLGRVPGRRSADEITLFKSLGVAAQDLMLAELLLRRSRT